MRMIRRNKQCPTCKRHLKRQFSWRGLLWGILCFPCGLLCCIRRKRMRCQSCGSQVIISTGAVPKFVQGYKDYRDSKWQFPSSSAVNPSEQIQRKPADEGKSPHEQERPSRRDEAGTSTSNAAVATSSGTHTK